MSRVFESWWWSTIMVVAFLAWAFLFPSNVREEPGLAIASHAALAISLVMSALQLGSWMFRVRRRSSTHGQRS